MTEEWRPVKGYEGFYEVSNKGNVRSLDRKSGRYVRKGRWLRPFLVPDENGYKHVCLSAYGVREQKAVHRLVAEAFVRNPDNKPQVNHIDENKLNNTADNLEWVTQQENLSYSNKGPASKKGKLLHGSTQTVLLPRRFTIQSQRPRKKTTRRPARFVPFLKGGRKEQVDSFSVT